MPLSEQRTPLILRLTGKVNRTALDAALNAVAQRHEILRTHYVLGKAGWEQIIRPADDVVVPYVDLSNIPAETQEEAVWEILNATFVSPAALDGPVLDLRLFRLSQTNHLLAGFIHHIAYDGQSSTLFWRELFRVYFDYVLGLKGGPRPLRTQYADFAVWEASWLTDDQKADNALYWCDILDGAQPLRLPGGRRLGAPGSPLRHCRFTIDPASYREILGYAQHNRMTVVMMLLAAIGAVLSRWSGQEKVVLAHLVNGRTPVVAETIGCFMHARPWLSDRSGDPTFGELMARGRRAHIDAADARRIPAPEVLKDYGVAAVTINVTQATDERGDGPTRILGLTIGEALLPKRFKTEIFHDLAFSISQRRSEIDGLIGYAGDCFEAHEVEAAAASIVRFLAEGSRGPDVRISQLLGEIACAPRDEVHA